MKHRKVRPTRILDVFMMMIVLIFPISCTTISMTNGSLSDRKDSVQNDAALTADVVRFDNVSTGPNTHILVIDPQGRKTGYDRRNDIELNEIPSAWYSGRDKAEVVAISNPVRGSYTFQITGSPSEAFSAGISYGEDNNLDRHEFQGVINNGSSLSAIIDVDPDSSEPIRFSVLEYE